MTRHVLRDRRQHKLRRLMLGGLAAAMGYLAVQSMPDLVRYLKIRNM